MKNCQSTSLAGLDSVKSIYQLGMCLYNLNYIKNEDIQRYHDDNIRGKEDIIGNNSKNSHILITGKDIKEIIPKQRQFDKAILSELNLMQEKSKKDHIVYSASFSVSYKFPEFKTSPETITLTTKPDNDNGFRLSLVTTLKSYNQILTEKSDIHVCWHYIDNEKLKAVLKNEKHDELSQQEVYSCSQIVSLFLCESSRNPSAYLTGPMSLEIAENEFLSFSQELGKINAKKDTLEITTLKTQLKKITGLKDLSFIEEIDDINSIRDLRNWLKIKVDNILEYKSKLIQVQLNKWFPMVMDQAVAASRHIYNILNKENQSTETHIKYDNGMANIARSKDLLKQDNVTFTQWLKYKKIDAENSLCALVNLIKDWYGIDKKELKFKAGGKEGESFNPDDESFISSCKISQILVKQEIFIQKLIQKCIEDDNYHLSAFAHSCDPCQRKSFVKLLSNLYIEPIVKILIDNKRDLSEHSVSHMLKLVLQHIECTQYGNTIFYGSGISQDFLKVNKIFYKTTLTSAEISRIFLTVEEIIKNYLSHLVRAEIEIESPNLIEESTQVSDGQFIHQQCKDEFIKKFSNIQLSCSNNPLAQQFKDNDISSADLLHFKNFDYDSLQPELAGEELFLF